MITSLGWWNEDLQLYFLYKIELGGGKYLFSQKDILDTERMLLFSD